MMRYIRTPPFPSPDFRSASVPLAEGRPGSSLRSPGEPLAEDVKGEAEISDQTEEKETRAEEERKVAVDTQTSEGSSLSSMMVLEILIKHAGLGEDDVSDLASERTSWGVSWLVLQMLKRGEVRLESPLERLDLSECTGLSPPKIFLLLGSLPNSTEDLTLGESAVGGAALPLLCKFLKSPSTVERLKKLTFAPESIGAEEASQVFPLLPPSLEFLSLNGNVLKRGLQAFAASLRSGAAACLKKLELNDTGLDVEGVKTFCSAVTAVKPRCLETLSVSGNRLGDEGMSVLAKILTPGVLPFMRALFLGNTGCLSKLVELIGKNKMIFLEVLDLEDERVDDQTAGELARILNSTALPYLRELNLSGTGIRREGAAALMSAFQSEERPPLETVSLSFSEVGEQEAKTLGGGGVPFRIEKLTVVLRGGCAIGFLNGVKDREEGEDCGWDYLDLILGSENAERDAEVVSVFAETIRQGRLNGGLWQLRLDLGGVKVTEILREMEDLREHEDCSCFPAVCRFDLREQMLSDEDLSSLGGVIRSGRLVNLESLLIAENSEIGKEGVEALFRGLSESVIQGENGPAVLEELDISHSKAGEGVGAAALVLSKGALPHVRQLSMRECQLSDEGMKGLGDMLRGGSLVALESLEVCENSFGRVGMESFFSAVSDCGLKFLRRLNMSYTRGGEGIGALGNALLLGQVPELRELELENCHLGDEGMEALGKAAREGHLSKLEFLDAAGNNVGKEGMISFFVGVAESEKQKGLESLKWLSLAGTRAGEAEGIAALSVALQKGKVPVLSYLRLSECCLGDEGLSALGGGVRAGGLKNVTDLVIGQNSFDKEGMDGFFGAVCELEEGGGGLESLEVLDLCETGGGRGVEALANALGAGRLPRLQHLVLSNSDLDDDGMRFLGEAFEKCSCPTLSNLGLSFNSLSPDGLVAFFGALKPQSLPTLSTLDVRLDELSADEEQRAAFEERATALFKEAQDKGKLLECVLDATSAEP
uniref:Uncharacterized protein n=1 Tax=Chromera velia CCMP2878 TaxID=1169474 RepID=A0A0G4I0D5_9ALVE|eukprot:Cvel_9917.t1-p1 / transcript=Cvel_9917.t1 / gene=Cvel_9917 / organism=Chromera_velia_CCMP2878 / gene_product=hypothetical protein / transcript_product=hypothetical protein / location=Cvel_scaffold585:73269-78704(-) / protein_length=996 / sequence_SO=supercontig / SO=protein_coding / is_pseudo=false